MNELNPLHFVAVIFWLILAYFMLRVGIRLFKQGLHALKFHEMPEDDTWWAGTEDWEPRKAGIHFIVVSFVLLLSSLVPIVMVPLSIIDIIQLL